MPLLSRLSAICLCASVAWAAPLAARAASLPADPGVAVFYEAPVLPGNPVRDGAAEFTVLLRIAQVRQHHSAAGLVWVGNRYALLGFKTQATVARVALMGVPVVKLPWGAQRPANPDRIFIEARAMAPAAAEALLADCLARYGALPVAVDPSRPTAREITAVQAKVKLYQARFDAASRPAEVAMR